MSPGAIKKPTRRISVPRERPSAAAPGDDVEVNSDDSFPASDAPSWTPVERIGRPRPSADESTLPHSRR